MGYDPAAPRRKVELELNDDLLRQATAVSPNLARVVEQLLAGHLEELARQQREGDPPVLSTADEIATYIAESNERTARLGAWADDLLTDE